MVAPSAAAKAPRTARGQRTLRKILDAARQDFGEKGFAESSIVAITRRAGVALGTFYTYFPSKEALFQTLIREMSAEVRDHVARALPEAKDPVDREERALRAFFQFIRANRQVYRIIDEAQFVDPDGYREHYENAAARIAARLRSARDSSGDTCLPGDDDLHVIAWAMMGANVFVGLRFFVWDDADAQSVAQVMVRLWRGAFPGTHGPSDL